MREKKIKSTKLESYFLCREVCKFIVNHIMAKKILKRTTVDTIVNKNMSPVYFNKNLYMEETSNHAMFFLNVNTPLRITNCM